MDILTLDEYWLSVIIAMGRITTFVLLFPIFKNRAIPIMAKAIIIVILSCFAAQNIEPVVVGHFSDLLLLIVFEALIGFVLVMFLEFVFLVVRAAGSFIDMDIGLMNPFPDGSNNSQSTPMSKIFFYIFLLVFILVGGIEKTFSGLLISFEMNPDKYFYSNYDFFEFFVGNFNYVFLAAIQIAIPFLMSTFIIYIALLLMSKSVDKINVLMNIFGVKILLGLTLVFLCIPALIIVFQQLEEQFYSRFVELFGYIFSER